MPYRDDPDFQNSTPAERVARLYERVTTTGKEVDKLGTRLDNLAAERERSMRQLDEKIDGQHETVVKQIDDLKVHINTRLKPYETRDGHIAWLYKNAGYAAAAIAMTWGFFKEVGPWIIEALRRALGQQ